MPPSAAPLHEEIRAITTTSHPLGVRVAAECARFVLPFFEREYPDNKQPRKAIEAAERWARNPTDRNRAGADIIYTTALDTADAAVDRADAIVEATGTINIASDVAADAARAAAYTAYKIVDATVYAVRATCNAIYAANGTSYITHVNARVDDVPADIVVSEWSSAVDAVRQHLVDTDWLVDYAWTEILRSPKVLAPQFPYTHGPFRVWTKAGESCWTLNELHARKRSRATDTILVAIDAAMQGVTI